MPSLKHSGPLYGKTQKADGSSHYYKLVLLPFFYFLSYKMNKIQYNNPICLCFSCSTLLRWVFTAYLSIYTCIQFIHLSSPVCLAIIELINNLLHLYSAFLGTQSTLHRRGISSSTTSVQHPPGWCDGSHSAPERPPHTSLLVERRQTLMKPISVWGGLGGHDGQRSMGKFGQDARVTPLHFFKGHPGIFNDHRESRPWFNISSKGRCFFTV